MKHNNRPVRYAAAPGYRSTRPRPRRHGFLFVVGLFLVVGGLVAWRFATPHARASAPSKQAHAVVVKPAPPSICAKNTDANAVFVNITQQHMWACAGSSQVYDTAVTTGAYTVDGDATPTGTWHIYAKQTNLYLTGPGYKDWVQYWMPFYSDYGFHDASWQTFNFGGAQYATDGSHGCVHLPTPAAAWLYNWAPIGTTVTIQA